VPAKQLPVLCPATPRLGPRWCEACAQQEWGAALGRLPLELGHAVAPSSQAPDTWQLGGRLPTACVANTRDCHAPLFGVRLVEGRGGCGVTGTNNRSPVLNKIHLSGIGFGQC